MVGVGALGLVDLGHHVGHAVAVNHGGASGHGIVVPFSSTVSVALISM